MKRHITPDIIMAISVGILMLLCLLMANACDPGTRIDYRIPTCEDKGKPGQQPAIALVVDACTLDAIDVDTFEVGLPDAELVDALTKTINAPVGEYAIDCIEFGVEYEATIQLDGYEGFDKAPFTLYEPSVGIRMVPLDGCEDPVDPTPLQTLMVCINDASEYVGVYEASARCCGLLRGDPQIDEWCSQ
jgi:hypothetical protein